MLRKRVKQSLKWKIMAIYFAIVFIVMTIAGVFITKQLEVYQINLIRDNCIKFEESVFLSIPFDTYIRLEENKQAIQAILEEWRAGTDYEMFVVDNNFQIIASDNRNVTDKNAIGILNEGVLVAALEGEISEQRDELQNGRIPVMNMGFPIHGSDGTVIGALYMRANLSNMYKTMQQSKIIYLEAMVIALIITLGLCFLIAKSITEPINNVTEKAKRMAEGDFSQEIEVKATDEIGQLTQMFNSLRKQLDYNITEISNEKNKLRTILNYMADGLIAVDLDGWIVHANPAAKELLDLTEDEIERKHFNDVLSRFSGDLTMEHIEKECRDGMISQIFNYRQMILSVRYARYMDDEKKDIGIIMLFQNITENQKLEKRQVEFVANVSHELKTPLTTIKSYTETLIDGAMEDRDTAKQFLRVIDAEADRMGRLVKDLLQLSRLDYQNEKMTLNEYDLKDLLLEATRKVKLTANGKQQQVNVLFNRDIPLIGMVDSDGMEQVFLNILSNAIKYTPEGGRIDIDAYKAAGLIKIVIADNGIGICEEELPRIFERFYRVDKARSRAMGGTGLGLSIAKQIVENHYGTIEAKSREGKGTQIIITLPLAWSRGLKNVE